MVAMLRALGILLACALVTGCGGGGRGSDDAAPLATATPAPTATSPLEPSPTPIPSPEPAPPPAVLAAGSSSVMRSDDGGLTWATTPELHIGSAIDFEEDVGWVVGSVVEGGQLRHTTDGGRTWRQEGAELGTMSPFFFDVDAIDERRAVIAGSDGDLLSPDWHRGPPAIFFTHDGGTTWWRAELRGVDVPSIDDVIMRRICVTAAGHGLAVGADIENYTTSLVLVTHDAGATWKAPPAAPSSLLSAEVECTGERDFWIADASEGLFHSSDAGATWRDLDGTLPEASPIRAIDFDDPSEGRLVTFANGALTLLQTRDGGAHWKSSVIPSASELRDVSGVGVDFHGGRGVVVLGNGQGFTLPPARFSIGMALATADGGATWTETVFPEPINALSDVALLP